MKKKRSKKEPKILKYMNSLSAEEIVDREKEFMKKFYAREIIGTLLIIGAILLIIIACNKL